MVPKRIAPPVVPKRIAPPKITDFTTVMRKGAFYIAKIILTRAKDLNLNLKLLDTVFRNATIISTVTAEM